MDSIELAGNCVGMHDAYVSVDGVLECSWHRDFIVMFIEADNIFHSDIRARVPRMVLTYLVRGASSSIRRHRVISSDGISQQLLHRGV